jgi:hypothetical protein
MSRNFANLLYKYIAKYQKNSKFLKFFSPNLDNSIIWVYIVYMSYC